MRSSLLAPPGISRVTRGSIPSASIPEIYARKSLSDFLSYGRLRKTLVRDFGPCAIGLLSRRRAGFGLSRRPATMIRFQVPVLVIG